MPINTGYITADRRDNELFTPYYAVTPIIKYLPKTARIWCPFDEQWSAFYVRLKECGFNVTRSSITEGKDFFSYEPVKWDIIVSNPPFSLKDQVLKRLYELEKPFAVLLPLNALQGKRRFEYLSRGVQLLTFDQRITYHDIDHMDTTVNKVPFSTAYFCRDLLPKDLIMEKLERYERRLGYYAT